MDQYILGARKAIESTYDRECDVIEYQAVINKKNKRTENKEVVVLEKKPCRISYETILNTNETEMQNNISQKIKLFIAPEIVIKEGSKIVVKKGNSIEIFKNSGIPARYDTHQEIILENFKGWA